MRVQKFKRYEYPLATKGCNYKGSYTIKDGVKPMRFKGEKLVSTFEAVILDKGERL